MPEARAIPQPLELIVIDSGDELAAGIESVMAASKRTVHLRTAANHLMAIGEAGRTDTAPPRAVLCPLSAINGQAETVIAALREVSPGATLIAAKAAGFDACVNLPLEPNALAAAIDAPRRHESRSHAAPTAALASLAAEPFDSSVIDELINPHGNPRDTALALLAQRSGIEGIAFSAELDDVPPHHARADVTCMNQTFGCLHAPPPAGADLLQPWADWLARWLLLHRQQQDLWFMAMRDELTGAWNRRYFNRFLRMVLQRAESDRSTVTLLLFDIDDFKLYNDRFGHVAGDDILRETVALMQSVVREQDVVARVGGDEFGVIFWDSEAPRRANSRHPTDVLKIADRFRKALHAHRFPKLASIETPLTISGGLASYPWDATTPDELIAKADAMAAQAKRDGKNAIRFGPA